jgi:hypothetical protein
MDHEQNQRKQSVGGLGIAGLGAFEYPSHIAHGSIVERHTLP